jgi:3D (Asp-Asp-Asp) domain-containing protein
VIEEKIFLNPQDPRGSQDARKKTTKIFRAAVKIVLISILVTVAWKACDVLWFRHRYLITAYCDCPICINVPEFRDGKFASQRPVYWGGVAADKSIPLGASVELVPFTMRDWFAVRNFLGDRRQFTVEDRGGKIRGRHIDIFFPQSRGGHETALHWGIRRMRIKINGRLMD